MLPLILLGVGAGVVSFGAGFCITKNYIDKKNEQADTFLGSSEENDINQLFSLLNNSYDILAFNTSSTANQSTDGQFVKDELYSESTTALVAKAKASSLIEPHLMQVYSSSKISQIAQLTSQLQLPETISFYAQLQSNPEQMPLLSTGMVSNEVKLFQQTLNKLYPNSRIVEDGNFGPETQKLVKRFQGEQKIPADGIVGPQTWTALETALFREPISIVG